MRWTKQTVLSATSAILSILLQFTFWKTFFFFNLLYSSYMVATGHQVFTVKLQLLDGKPITDTKYVELKVIFRKQSESQRN